MAATATQEQERTIAAWQGFRTGLWQTEINVRDFIQQNCEPYDGDESFLAPATARTQTIWKKLQELFAEERRKGALDIVSSATFSLPRANWPSGRVRRSAPRD
jgi:formate C-acetyltransferase